MYILSSEGSLSRGLKADNAVVGESRGKAGKDKVSDGVLPVVQQIRTRGELRV